MMEPTQLPPITNMIADEPLIKIEVPMDAPNVFTSKGTKKRKPNVDGSQVVNDPDVKREFFVHEDREQIFPVTSSIYFDVIMSRSHVKPIFLFVFPKKMDCEFPQENVEATLKCRGKIWKMTYIGAVKGNKRFDMGWKEFVEDNGIQCGDGCVFELVSKSDTQISFFVQILRGAIPYSCIGADRDAPILIE